MMVLLLLLLPVLLQSCSCYTFFPVKGTHKTYGSSHALAYIPHESVLLTQRMSRGNRHFRYLSQTSKTLIRRHSAALGTPESEPPAEDDDAFSMGKHNGVETGFSAVLANYPRSPFSKVGLKNKKRDQVHRQSEEEEALDFKVLFDNAELMRFVDQFGQNKPKPEKQNEETIPHKELQNETQPLQNPEALVPANSKVREVAEQRLSGLLSASSTGIWLCVGRVSGAHGLRGHVKINPMTFAKTERFCTPGSRLFFRSPGMLLPFISRAVEEGRLLTRAGGGQRALVKFHGINNRDNASSLAGFLVYVHPAQSVVILPPKCILAAELVGFKVTLLHDAERTPIGHVVDVISKHDMRLREEAVGAADDCLQIEVYRDLPGRRLLLEHFRDPAPPPAPLLASALHALGGEAPIQSTVEEVPVLFECEGCGLRFTDCTAAVCHERICLTSKNNGSQSVAMEQGDALNWLLKGALGSTDAPAAGDNPQLSSFLAAEREHVPATEVAPTLDVGGLRGLQSLEGPGGRSGSRLGRRFLHRLSLGDRVSWDRAGRFFPHPGEAAEEAADRALNFACNSQAGRGYSEADWNDPSDVTALSNHLIAPVDIQPAACNADKNPSGQLFLLPFVLGVTVDCVDTEAKTLGINAPPALLH